MLIGDSRGREMDRGLVGAENWLTRMGGAAMLVVKLGGVARCREG
jgi:hypothetical protein